MKKISKADQKAFESLRNALGTIGSDIDEMIGDLAIRVSEYNEKVAEIHELRDEQFDHIKEYIDDRSERWQESEKAESYENWLASWDNFELEEAEEPEAPIINDFEFDELLWSLEEAEG